MTHKIYVPTFEEALKITQANPCFTHRYREVDGFKISVFDYLLASYQDFAQPSEEVQTPAFELRGLCFTHTEAGPQRFLMLHKFFNLNQCANYQLDEVKHKKVIKVMDKLDGSVMRFIQLPDGRVIAKSKTFFDNDQTLMATRYLNFNANLKAFVEESIAQGLAAIFELTSPLNRIVVAYKETKLTLIALRDEVTGEYLDLHTHALVTKYNLEPVQTEHYSTLEEMLALKPILLNKEGWIVVLEDGQMIKIKLDEYIRLHGIFGESLAKEDLVMGMIIDNTIDDALAELDLTDLRRPPIEAIIHKTSEYLLAQAKEAMLLVAEYKGDKKEWAMAFNQNPLFPIASRVLTLPVEQQEDALIEKVKEMVKRETYRLKGAQEFIKNKLKLPLLREFNSSED